MGEIEDGFYWAGVYDGEQAQRERFTPVLAEAVIKLMDRSFSLEEALDLVCVPEDCLDGVREAVLSRMER